MGIRLNSAQCQIWTVGSASRLICVSGLDSRFAILILYMNLIAKQMVQTVHQTEFDLMPVGYILFHTVTF